MLEVKNQSLNSEFKRIKKLSEFDLDYFELHDEVKNLVELAGIIAGTEISVLNLIDSHIQWSISAQSSEPNQSPREESVCDYTINSSAGLEIQRLDLDNRFCDKEYVKGENGLKYYLGIPLTLDSGENIGAICMADRHEKSIPDSVKKALRLIASEIVEKLEAKKKMNETIFSLYEAVRVKNQIAHDVRGPVHGIAGLAETVESEDLSTEEMREYFKLIKESGKGVIDLTDEILASDKVSEKFKSRYINFKQLKDKLYRLYQLPSKSKQIDFQVVTRDKDARYFFSKRKLLSIIGNLISNAIKFTPQGGIIRVYLNIVNSVNGKKIQVIVQDNGKGISREAIQDFYHNRLDATKGTEGEIGFGLGLKLVNEMVNDLQGMMDISSDESHGAKIEVKLPLK